MQAAIIIELAQGIITGEAWLDFAILCALQLANAIIGFIEEHSAGNAIDALKSQLAPTCTVIREGAHTRLPSKELVPGDLVELKLGDVVPADAILLPGKPLQVDQAALTGESLPVTAPPGALIMMSSAVKMGHSKCIIVATGRHTFIGTAAKLMSETKHVSNMTKVLFSLTIALLVMCVVACACIFARLMTFPPNPNTMIAGAGSSLFLQSLSIVVVILVASIPVAIEVVVTSTMAVGSHIMASKKVIVARLSAIEELAGMTVLCSDKTGTLTLNKLSLREPILVGAQTSDELLLAAALASKRDGDLDAIDTCIMKAQSAENLAVIAAHTELDHTPFDPVAKRTLSIVRRADGTVYKVSKGAPQVLLRMAWNTAEIASKVTASVDDLASRGFRSLGVARSMTGPDVPEKWEYLGILSLFDPPRPDSAATIKEALANGVDVKMVTGDHGKIAKETCRELGMGTSILNTEQLDDHDVGSAALDKVIMEAHGFAEVLPEHKYLIVKRIQAMGHCTGMTGDGVNDAPALKQADIGIAVHGATDAARAAAAIVLTEEGISVIITAMFESRKIFQRMRNYITYRIACTLQLLFFFFFTILIMQTDMPFFYGDSASPTWPGNNVATNPYSVAGGACGNGGTCLTGPPTAALGAVLPVVYMAQQQGPFNSFNCPVPPTSATPAGVFGCVWTNPGYPVAPVAELSTPDTSNNLEQVTAHPSFFSLPVFSLVIITILNDGCMITISGDYVLPSKLPQRWDMWKVWVIASVLGAVALLSSLVLVAMAMNANYLHPGTVVGTLWGSRGRNFLLYYEVQTILYLKVSISDFLTLFSARTSGWFWSRRLSLPLLFAFIFATGASTLLALFWGDIFATQPSNFMASLRFSNGAVVSTWIYCILWWILQDICKMGAHWLIDNVFATEADVALRMFGKAREASALPRVKSEHKMAVGEQAVVDHHVAEANAAHDRLAAVHEAPPQLASVAAVVGVLGGSSSATPVSTLGKGTSLGRRAVPLIAASIPDGSDLNAVLRNAQSSISRQHTVGRLPPRAPAISTIFPAGVAAHAVPSVAAHSSGVHSAALPAAAVPAAASSSAAVHAVAVPSVTVPAHDLPVTVAVPAASSTVHAPPVDAAAAAEAAPAAKIV